MHMVLAYDLLQNILHLYLLHLLNLLLTLNGPPPVQPALTVQERQRWNKYFSFCQPRSLG